MALTLLKPYTAKVNFGRSLNTMIENQSVKTERMVDLIAVSPEIRKSVEAAFRSYESRLFHAALRVTRNEDDAWDAVQEGMVSALRHAERFRGDAAVASWMYSIVVNAALYQRRRAVARKRGVDKYTERVWPDAEQSVDTCTQHRDPETYVMARVELARAAAQIALLPRDKRALVEQSIGGDSCAEIAETAGQPVAAVKSKLWRTRCALREQMGVDAAA
jgi:RNA polymerase sigma-70 factor, ECF subfamily